MRLTFVLGLVSSFAAAAATVPSSVTFSKDVAPILQKNCQSCHRPGEAAPMPLLTYQQARPWAKAIKEAVLLKKMPPWFADPHYGKFRNDRTMSQAEISTLVAWADSGAPEGDPKNLPAPASFIDGWNIGKPDVEVAMTSAFHIPAAGTIEYQYVIVPTHFTEDRWVQAAEIRPGNRALVHHVIAFLRPPESKWFRDHQPGEIFVPEKQDHRAANGNRRNNDESGGEMLAGYAPGLPAGILAPGQARLVKAGSDIVFQLHYTANGKPGDDLSKVGLVFSKEPPRQRVMTLAAQNRKFVIPAGDPNYRVDAEFEMGHDAQLVAMLPHMHLRGKDFEYRAVYPTGESQMLLKVPRYDFSWQLWYMPQDQLMLPKGTRIECTAHFDNSVNNPGNPDAAKEVRWGDQSWEEMMIGFFDVAFDAHMDPKSLFPEKKKQKNDSAD